MPAAHTSAFTEADLAHFAETVRGLPRLSILVAQVDPDGIGSALGLAAIARSLGVEADTYYAGAFGHPQSVVLWEAFGLEERARRFAAFDPASPVALVDSSRTVDPRFGNRPLDPAVVIDHHGDSRVVAPGRFHFVAPVGAASSLVADIGFRLGVAFDADVATLLALGILTDTDGLTSVGTRPLDRHMYARLMDAGDQQLVYRISRFPMTERACTLVQRLLTHRSIYRGSILLSHPTDALSAEEGEYLAIAADILVRHKDARLVIAFGLVGEQIRVSARTREPSLPLATILAQLFGAETSGAKEGSGGALLPLPQGLRVGRRREDHFREFHERLETRLAELDLPAVP